MLGNCFGRKEGREGKWEGGIEDRLYKVKLSPDSASSWPKIPDEMFTCFLPNEQINFSLITECRLLNYPSKEKGGETDYGY